MWHTGSALNPNFNQGGPPQQRVVQIVYMHSGDLSVKSRLGARKPQYPTKSEEYQGYLQGMLYSTRGAQTSKTLDTNVVNIQDSQEQA
eukprot:3291548-Pyramimonas_sp.AAC.1